MEWTGQVYADAPTVAAEIYVEAPPERVWPLVSDIFLMARLSTELRQVEWLGGATSPALGHRFAGRNANPALGEWETVSTIVECDEPRRFAWAVGDTNHPGATWRFTLRPDGPGTVLEQWAQMGRLAPVSTWLSTRCRTRNARSCSCGCGISKPA